MNRYLFFHRIKGPVIILVFGVTALLDVWHVMSFGKSWPFYLIALGLLQLAERAAWSQMQAGTPSSGYAGGSGERHGDWGGPGSAGPSSSALSIAPRDFEEREGR